METIIQHLTDYMAAVTWLDFVDSAILIGIAAYALHRIETKFNPLVQQVNALTQSNKDSLRIIDEQDAEIKELRKKYQALHYKEVRSAFLDQRQWCRDN